MLSAAPLEAKNKTDIDTFQTQLQLAQQDNAQAQAYIGFCYDIGQGVKQDFAQAVEWYQKAADQGNASAQYNLGSCYDTGRGFTQDYNQAVAWYQKAADQGIEGARVRLDGLRELGHTISLTFLGDAQESKASTPSPPSTPTAYLEKPIFTLDEHADVMLSAAPLEAKNKTDIDTFQTQLQLAQQGNAQAQAYIGFCYKNGLGVAWLQTAADQGRAWAQYNLGLCYTKGQGVNYDSAQAVAWYQTAADQGYADAQFTLGTCYYSGRGVKQDFAQAVEWYQKAADQGHALAQYNLGSCYDTGQGVKQDYNQAVAWYQKAADQGDVDARVRLDGLRELGHAISLTVSTSASFFGDAKESKASTPSPPSTPTAYLEKPIFTLDEHADVMLSAAPLEAKNKTDIDTFQTQLQLAQQGNAQAQAYIDFYYKNGLGVAWLQTAADQGHAWAQFTLGTCYYSGRGVKQDFAQAVEWYQKAADQGHVWAQYNLGLCYDTGQGVKQDYNQAVAWYQKAADQGDVDARVRLDGLRKQGHIIFPTVFTSASFLGDAKESKATPLAPTIHVKKPLFTHEEHADVMLSATPLEAENKTDIDTFQTQLQLAQQGNAQSQTYIGFCYYIGQGVTQDFAQAVEWYQKAADQGDALAQCSLGVCYENGQGVKQDYNQAVAWYQKAADQGNVDARARLEELRKQGHVIFPAVFTSASFLGDAKESKATPLAPTIHVEEPLFTHDEQTGVKELLAERKTIGMMGSAAIVSASQVSIETFEALATVPAKTLQAVAHVSPEAFLTLSTARPIILQALIRMGEDQEKIEQEYEEIHKIPVLQEYYDFFQRAISAVIAGSLAVKSAMVKDTRQSSAEKVVSWVSQNIQIPLLQGSITYVLEKLVALGSDRSRSLQINRLSICFSNLQNSGALVEMLARYLTLAQKADILRTTKPSQRGRFKELVTTVKKLVKWVRADDVNTPVRAMAAEQAEVLINHLMGKEASGALTPKDVPALASEATKGKVVSLHHPVSSATYSTGLITSSLSVIQAMTVAGAASGNTMSMDAALLAKTANAAHAADSKATSAAEQALNAQKEAAEAKQKAAQLEKELVEKNKRIEEMERREQERAAREVREHHEREQWKKEMEKRQSRSESELSRARAKLGKVDVLDDLLTEVNAAGDQKQLNVSAADRIEGGFARLQARDDEGRRVVIAEVTVLKETVSELQDSVQALKEQAKQKQRKKPTTPFWRSDNKTGQSTAVSTAVQKGQKAPAKIAFN